MPPTRTRPRTAAPTAWHRTPMRGEPRSRPRATPARERTSVFGPGAVLTARLPLSNTGANTADPHLCDAYTGPIMAIADADAGDLQRGRGEPLRPGPARLPPASP